MPPKRLPKATSSNTIDDADENPAKKLKTANSFVATSSGSQASQQASQSQSTQTTDERQVCWYDGNCKQKNPAHWLAYRHEKQTGPIVPPTPTVTAPKVKPLTVGYAASSSSDDSDSDDYLLTKKKAPTKGPAKKKVLTSKKKKIASSSSDYSDSDSDSEPIVKPKPKAATKSVVNTNSNNNSNNANSPKKASATGKTTKASSTVGAKNPPPLTKKHSLSQLLGPNLSNQTNDRQALVDYSHMVRLFLSGKHEIDGNKKKILLEFRKKEEITKEEHEVLLGTFGWSCEEYEVGEREPDHDYDLKEELDIYKNPAGFKILTLTSDMKLTKEQEAVWAKASAKFFQTMSKAQGNFTIKSLGIIMNTKLNQTFMNQKRAFEERDKKLGAITWGFHGSTPESIRSIAKEGFRMPDELKKKKGKSKVDLLDDGYFGNGIYFSIYSDYAMWYSEERESDEILLSALLQGEPYQCTARMDGQGCQKGYDSQISPKKNEIIVFNQSQILPRFIIKFEMHEEQEREQED